MRPGRPVPVVFARPGTGRRRSGGTTEKLVEALAPGITLGVVDDVGGEPQKLALEDGHLMVMHTHGLTEARDACGSVHGEPRLMQALSRAPAAGAA